MNNALYNQIRIFQSIAREGNISAAARKLEITPPSVSNALRLLEEHIGHPLFVRTTRRIELTETGQQLLEQTAAAV
ncbi:LysR family transcriptional regulator, partial [Klebsiella pneumoniae]